MPCTGDGSTGSLGARVFRNWARTSVLTIANYLQPANVRQMAAGVAEVERIRGVLKGVGSGWSYTGAAVTNDVSHLVDNSRLARVLNGTDPGSPAAAMFPYALKNDLRPRARYFVHVEAGIKIHALNCELDSRCLAMPTLGGSNGQSLAGVLSTATHGGDVDRPPIADAVRAIHLVGPGGLEWWIERSGDRAITTRQRVEDARAAEWLCGDARIEYDDDLFNAVLVSVGRMGLIYSVVLEAVDAFRLRQQTETTTWTPTSAWIRSAIVNAATYAGPRFVEVVVSPYRNAAGDRDCVITRRFDTEDDPTKETPPPPDIFGMLCNIQGLSAILTGLSALLPALVIGATAAALAAISWMLAIPFVGGILFAIAAPALVTAATAALIALETALLSAIAAPGENLASKLASICNLAVAAGQKQIVPQLVNAMVGFIRPNAPEVVRAGFRLMTGQERCGTEWKDAPNCMREIDGLEFALNATPGHEDLFLFLDDVFALTQEFYDRNRPAAFGMSLRFTRGTEALIGMQQHARTGHVEFLMLRGFASHADFRNRLYAIARRRNAIPHWGLIHEIDAAEVQRLYGDRHTRWKRALGRLIQAGGGQAATFRTSFSIQRDLEPLMGCLVPRPIVDLFRRLLLSLARARGMRGASKPDERDRGRGRGRDHD